MSEFTDENELAARREARENTVPVTSLPYGMKPAPRRKHKTRLFDLGELSDEYVGWQVVFDLELGLDTYEKLAAAQDAASNVETIKLMREFIGESTLAWNFVEPEEEGGGLLAGPRAGGVAKLSPTVLNLMSQAFGKAIEPPKGSEKPSN